MRYLFLLFLLSITPFGFAQTVDDAILFGQDKNVGTARFMGMVGSFGALGANATSTMINPGGLAVYRKGELTFSLLPSWQGFNTTHYGNSESSLQSATRVSNLAATFSNEIMENDWIRFNVQFGYNRKNNFDADLYASGVNSQSSKLDQYLYDILESGVFVEDIYDYFPFGAGLAWDILLIDTANGEYYHALENYGHEQSRKDRIRGGSGDYYIAGAANYNNKLYIGGGLALSVINYYRETEYRETPLSSNNLTDVRLWQETEELTISGRGLNINLGFLYWFTEKIRGGLAYNAGTNFTITERYTKDMFAIWKNGDTTNSTSPNGYNEYNYKSPFDLVFSFALVDKYIGSLNFDAQWVTYNNMFYSSNSNYPIDFSSTNQEMEDRIRAALNLRLGGELLLGPAILRAGGALYGNPDKSGSYFNQYAVSGGVGLRIKRLTLDAGYVYTGSVPDFKPIHFAENVYLEQTETQFISHQLALTLSYKFNQLK